jgi:pyruvate ferredoxin oxidoreductase beta subunit/2-oxoisovalerate ferredoxin oxidoreductase beta subunit
MRRLEVVEEAMFCSGHAACPGCIEALSVRHVLATLGPDTVAVVPPSCMAIIAGPQPFSSLRIPVYQPTLESSAAAASGIRRALDAQGKRDTQVVVFAGYMNTGAQKSSSTPRFASTGSTPAGKLSRKKNLTEIMAAHEIPYAATATAGYLPDLIRKVNRAKSIRGTRLLTLLIPCIDGWGLTDDGGLGVARLAVESGVFPLYEVEDGYRYTLSHDRRTRKVAEYLAPQRRYRHLKQAEIDTLQEDVDAGWERLLRRVAASEVRVVA